MHICEGGCLSLGALPRESGRRVRRDERAVKKANYKNSRIILEDNFLLSYDRSSSCFT